LLFSFSFVIGEEVGEEAKDLAEGFVYMEIPAGKYAEFDASGPHGWVQDIRNYIYGTWLPNSNFERREGPDYAASCALGQNQKKAPERGSGAFRCYRKD
jgi:predicted transcriptional regulator YdeE